MNLHELVEQARDAITVRRVYGDPYETGGTTIIPAADVFGGGGGGTGEDKQAGQEGGGGGFGVIARPAGAYVIKNGEVRWQPAVDVNRIVSGALTLAALAVIAGAVGRRRRRKEPQSTP
jgi:uncharacterized spore protein YtfJ